MKIAYVTAGAAGMFCGSCLRDNTLVSALRALGHDALLIPTYTPIRTDEPDASQSRVFFGGVNVFLQEKFALFRKTPWLLDRLLDAPRLLRWLGRFAGKTQAADLGDLTLSMLNGEDGRQRKEFRKLADWMRSEPLPDVVVLTNVLLSGLAPSLRSALGRPVVAMLQGDDVFLDALPAPVRTQAIERIRANAASLAGLFATCDDYADHMASYLGLPRTRIDVVPPGIVAERFPLAPPRPADRPFTIGYFARISPEKGLHTLIDAYVSLRRESPEMPLRLRVGGWLGEQSRAYLAEQEAKLANEGDRYRRVDCPTHADKERFFAEIDVLSVPTVFREPKGLYVLEAWASGLPVVQPRRGAFPELLANGGGLLCAPDDPLDLARKLRQLAENPALRATLAAAGRAEVTTRYHATTMARTTAAALERVVRAAR